MNQFLGKRALVLGASAEVGSGWATAIRLAAEGARVAVGARTAAGIEKLARQINGVSVQCDVSREADVLRLAHEVEAQMGGLDIAINAAGHPFTGSIDTTAQAELQEALAINFIGPFLFIKHMARLMPSGGSIVIYTSNSARRVVPGFVPYGCAKAAATALVRYAAIEYAGHKIRVNAVEPGFIASPMAKAVLGAPEIMQVMIKEIPLGRAVSPEEVAAAALWLCRSDAYVTGIVLEVDGGQHLRRPPWVDEMPPTFHQWIAEEKP